MDEKKSQMTSWNRVGFEIPSSGGGGSLLKHPLGEKEPDVNIWQVQTSQ